MVVDCLRDGRDDSNRSGLPAAGRKTAAATSARVKRIAVRKRIAKWTARMDNGGGANRRTSGFQSRRRRVLSYVLASRLLAAPLIFSSRRMCRQAQRVNPTCILHCHLAECERVSCISISLLAIFGPGPRAHTAQRAKCEGKWTRGGKARPSIGQGHRLALATLCIWHPWQTAVIEKSGYS